MHDVLSLGLEELLRGYFFFSFLFLSLWALTKNHVVGSLLNFPRTTLQSCLQRGGYPLCSHCLGTKLVSNATAIGEEVRGRVFSLILVRVGFLD